jgi:hypothetical protein
MASCYLYLLIGTVSIFTLFKIKNNRTFCTKHSTKDFMSLSYVCNPYYIGMTGIPDRFKNRIKMDCASIYIFEETIFHTIVFQSTKTVDIYMY